MKKPDKGSIRSSGNSYTGKRSVHSINNYFIKTVFLFSCILFSGFSIFSESINLRFEHILPEHGLSQSVITSLEKDSEGFLWIGTQDGLNRYNGYEIDIFRNVSGNIASISGNYINCIYEDSSNILWIGTEYDGLNAFDLSKGNFSHFISITKDPATISSYKIFSICEERRGEKSLIWIGTDNGLNMFNPENGEFERFNMNDGENNSLSSNIINDLIVDRSGILWIGTNNGLNMKRGGTKKILRFLRNKNVFGSDSINCMLEKRDGSLLIGTGAGLVEFDTVKKTYSPLNGSDVPPYLNIGAINCLHIDRNGTLWVGTDFGLYRFESEKGKWNHYFYDSENPNSLSGNHVFDIEEDPSGILWIGVGGGIDKLNLKYNLFNSYDIDPDIFTNPNVTSILEDEDEVVWIGTLDGLNRYDLKSNSIKHYFKTQGADTDVFSILSLSHGSSGDIWIATRGRGLIRFNKDSGISRTYLNNPKDNFSLGNNKIYSLFINESGKIWIGTKGGGLNILDPDTGEFRRFIHDPENPESICNNYVNSIVEDKEKNIWIGTRSGINKYSIVDGSFRHYLFDRTNQRDGGENYILSLIFDENGTLWAGTVNGLKKMDPDSGEFKSYGTNHGLPNNMIYGILPHGSDFFWISTNNGISRFDKKKEVFTNFFKGDGLQCNEFNQGSYHKGKSGKFYFGGVKGINIFYPENINIMGSGPNVVLASFKIFGKEVSSRYHYKELKKIVLPFDRNYLSFEFVALDLLSPEQNRYAYRMVNFDKNFIYSDRRRYAEYKDLSPGKYILKVIGANSHGLWNREGLSITIQINPPFWKTWWFILAGVIAISVFLFYASILFLRFVKLDRFWKSKVYVGKYKLLKKIGTGGMAVVYRAVVKNGKKSEEVALKLLKKEYLPDSEQRKRFISEGMIIDRIKHPNIVKIYERGEIGNSLYIAMELLAGETLSEKIKKEGRISEDESIDILIQISEAISTLHNLGIIHRDLKPDNFMILKRGGNTDLVKILDFGIAKTRDVSGLTESGNVVGTVYYLSPERVSGIDYTYATDIYSLGVIFYEMVTGEKLFAGETNIEIMKKILRGPALSRLVLDRFVGEKTTGLIKSMIDNDQTNRPSAEELLITLKKLKTLI